MAEPGSARAKGAKGSMGPFWGVLGLAALVLGVYLTYTPTAGGIGSTTPASAGKRPMAPAGAVLRFDHPGSSVTLADFKGKVVVLHFWATWCAPCRAEFPQFTRYASSEVGESGVVVLPVSLDQSPEPVGPFLSSAKATFPVYMDGGLAEALQVTAIPTTVVLDRDGRVAYKTLGAADWSSKGVPAVVQRLSRE